MKTLDKIPTGKIERASNLLKAGAKVGVNYLKYYGNKITKDEDEAKKILHEDNASDIYDSLKELKGSALKVAQMLSMEKNIMPAQYVEKFSLSQFSVPPLSGALVRKTFRTYFGKNPEDIFEEFSPESVNAASIGQVHKAKNGGKEFAAIAEHGEHLAFGHHDVLHGAAVVEQRVVGTVFRIEIDFHRHHEIHGGDQNRQERQ